MLGQQVGHPAWKNFLLQNPLYENQGEPVPLNGACVGVCACLFHCQQSCVAGFIKTQVSLKKPNPQGFIGFYSLLGFSEFFVFL